MELLIHQCRMPPNPSTDTHTLEVAAALDRDSTRWCLFALFALFLCMREARVPDPWRHLQHGAYRRALIPVNQQTSLERRTVVLVHACVVLLKVTVGSGHMH